MPMPMARWSSGLTARPPVCWLTFMAGTLGVVCRSPCVFPSCRTPETKLQELKSSLTIVVGPIVRSGCHAPIYVGCWKVTMSSLKLRLSSEVDCWYWMPHNIYTIVPIAATWARIYAPMHSFQPTLLRFF